MTTVTVEAESVLGLLKVVGALGEEVERALNGRERELEDELRKARLWLVREDGDDA